METLKNLPIKPRKGHSMEPIAARIIPLTTDIEISRGTKTNSTWEAIVIESPEAALD